MGGLGKEKWMEHFAFRNLKEAIYNLCEIV